MSLRKNLTIVPSATPEANQVKERVSLFNEDGSPFSGGGGKRLLYHAYHNATRIPLSDLVEASPTIYRLDLNKAEYVRHKDPDVTFFAPGVNHASWGDTPPGVVVMDLPKDSLITVSFTAQFKLYGAELPATGTMRSVISAYLFPDSEDGWSSPDWGIYKEKMAEVVGSDKPISSYNNDYLNLVEQYTSTVYYQFVNKQDTNQALELKSSFEIPAVGTDIEPDIPMFEVFVTSESI